MIQRPRTREAILQQLERIMIINSLKEVPVVNDTDFAVSKIMIAMKEVGNDAAFIEAMIGMLMVAFSKKNQTSIKNIIVFESGGLCVNVDEDTTINQIKQKIKSDSEVEK